MWHDLYQWGFSAYLPRYTCFLASKKLGLPSDFHKYLPIFISRAISYMWPASVMLRFEGLFAIPAALLVLKIYGMKTIRRQRLVTSSTTYYPWTSLYSTLPKVQGHTLERFKVTACKHDLIQLFHVPSVSSLRFLSHQAIIYLPWASYSPWVCHADSTAVSSSRPLSDCSVLPPVS